MTCNDTLKEKAQTLSLILGCISARILILKTGEEAAQELKKAIDSWKKNPPSDEKP